MNDQSSEQMWEQHVEGILSNPERLAFFARIFSVTPEKMRRLFTGDLTPEERAVTKQRALEEYGTHRLCALLLRDFPDEKAR